MDIYTIGPRVHRFESQQPLEKTQVPGSDSTKVLRCCESPAAVAERNLDDGKSRHLEKQEITHRAKNHIVHLVFLNCVPSN